MFWRSRNSADIPTKLACLSDFEKSGQLPVQEVVGGTTGSVKKTMTLAVTMVGGDVDDAESTKVVVLYNISYRKSRTWL